MICGVGIFAVSEWPIGSSSVSQVEPPWLILRHPRDGVYLGSTHGSY